MKLGRARSLQVLRSAVKNLCTCCKGKLCGCGFFGFCGLFVCGFWLPLFGFLVLVLPLLPACLTSFTDWCLVHPRCFKLRMSICIYFSFAFLSSLHCFAGSHRAFGVCGALEFSAPVVVSIRMLNLQQCRCICFDNAT